MLRALAVVVATAALAIGLGSSAQAGPRGLFADGYTNTGPEPDPTTPVVTPEAAGGSIEVTVTTSGSTVEGTPFARSAVRSIPPLCWYGQGKTGQEYYEYWKPGGVARESGTLDAFAAQGLLHADFESHATDTEGHWYEATCRYDAPGDQATKYYLFHPAVWVGPADPVPPSDADVDPEVLAQIAFDAMDLPQGTIRWNPTLEGSGATVVNLDTWVWVEGAPTAVSVTAQVPSGTWARVDASMDQLNLTAPGASPVSCADTGVAWTAGATSTSCKIVFTRSTANQPIKAGYSVPTSTLTATGSWSASWVSSANPTTPTALPAQDLTSTAEIPVAEIQTLVTR